MAIHVVGPRWGPAHLLAFDPGCAAFAATLGCVVKPFHGDKHRCAALLATLGSVVKTFTVGNRLSTRGAGLISRHGIARMKHGFGFSNP